MKGNASCGVSLFQTSILVLLFDENSSPPEALGGKSDKTIAGYFPSSEYNDISLLGFVQWNAVVHHAWRGVLGQAWSVWVISICFCWYGVFELLVNLKCNCHREVYFFLLLSMLLSYT